MLLPFQNTWEIPTPTTEKSIPQRTTPVPVMEILIPVDQVNVGGMWNEAPSVADQADLVDDGVGTHDGDTTHIWTSAPNKYLTLSYGDLTDEGIIQEIKVSLVVRGIDTSVIRGLLVGVYLSGQAIVTPRTLNLGTVPDTWTAIQTTWAAADFQAPWVGLTGAVWNSENVVSPGGRTLWQAKSLADAGDGESWEEWDG